MKRERLFVLPSPYRDEFRIHGFRFGTGRKSIAVVGAMRGDELPVSVFLETQNGTLPAGALSLAKTGAIVGPPKLNGYAGPRRNGPYWLSFVPG